MNARPSRLRASRSSGEASTGFWLRSAARGQSASSAAAVAWSASARARRPASVICGTGLPPTREGYARSGALGYTNCTGYASGVVPYLSEIQHRRVIEPNGNEVGKLADIAVVPQGQFPAAQWAILSTPSGEKVVRWGDLAQEIGHRRLRNRLETTPDAQLPPEALRLARDLLDKQIVDTHGAKVVRVNDLQLSEVDGQLRLVGADVGLRGLLRRVGAESVAERVAGLAGRRLPRGIIPWHLVEPLEPPEDAPGGIMTTDFVALPRELTAAQAIDELRAKKPDPQLTYYLYVVDGEGKLEGVLSLRDLVVAPPETKVGDIMDPNVLKVDAETPKEEVAALIAKYDLLGLPVVDARKRLLGTVTVDDVVELMLPRGWKKRSLRSIAR